MEEHDAMHSSASEERTELPETELPAVPKSRFRSVLTVCSTLLEHSSWLVMLFGSILLVGYYILFPSRAYFHSDTTDTLMWAAASYEGGTLFNPDFGYACLLPFSTSLIMTALIPIFGVSMTTHVLGMLIFFLLFTGALIWMCRSMQWSWHWTSIMVFTVLMLLSGSEKIREIFWGHTIYYSLGVFFLFAGLALLFRFMNTAELIDSSTGSGSADGSSTKLLLFAGLIGFWFIAACTNQLVAMTIFALPLLAAVFFERWLDTEHKLLCSKNYRTLALLAIMASCMLIGYLLTELLANGIYANYQEMHSSFSPMEEWTNNLLKFPEHWLRLLGADVHDGEPLVSGNSIPDLLTIVTGVVILVLPLVALCCYQKIEDARLRILILTYWFMTALIMLGYVCGKLSTANWRLSPIAAMSAVVSVAFLRWTMSRISMQRIISMLMIPVFASALFSTFSLAQMPANSYHDTELYQLAAVLEENDLHYGYATFWRANAITVISDSQVKCRSVNIGESGVSMDGYQSLRSWYLDQPEQETYFLLMSVDELHHLKLSESSLLELEHQEIPAEGYMIWVFAENIIEEETAEAE